MAPDSCSEAHGGNQAREMQKARTKAGHHTTQHPTGTASRQAANHELADPTAQPGAKITRAPGLAQHASEPGVSPGRTTPPYSVPGKPAIYAAVPGGSRRARSQREWLHAALDAIEAEGWYANRRSHYAGVCRVLMRHMNWRDRTTRPGHAGIAAAVGVSADTVARAVRWLEDRGLLGLVSAGTTAAIRPAVLYAGTANLAAIYVLTVPRRRSQAPRVAAGQAGFADLTTPRSGVVKALRAREASPKVKSEKARAPRGQSVLPPGTSALHHCPRTRSEALAVAAAVQARSRHLGRISAEHLRHVARSFFAAGWTGADVLAAIDHEPGGRQHGYVSGIRSPGRWAAYRLGLWLSPGGLPVPSRSQLAAAERDRDRAEQWRRRAERRAPAGYAEGAALARALLAARRTASPSRPGSPTPPQLPAEPGAPPRSGRGRPAPPG